MDDREPLLTMIEQGDIYWYDNKKTDAHPLVVLSRRELNRGQQLVGALLTSADFDYRSTLPNCVPFRAGDFGLTKDCVLQGESVFSARVAHLDLDDPIGRIDEETMRDVIRAIGDVFDADCEPC